MVQSPNSRVHLVPKDRSCGPYTSRRRRYFRTSLERRALSAAHLHCLRCCNNIPLTSAGAHRRAGGRTAGAALLFAPKARERTYPGLRHSARCKLVVLALKLGGCWSHEAANFVRLLACLRARAALASSRGPAVAAFVCRWSSYLSFAAARAFAASLLSLPLTATANEDFKGSPYPNFGVHAYALKLHGAFGCRLPSGWSVAVCSWPGPPFTSLKTR